MLYVDVPGSIGNGTTSQRSAAEAAGISKRQEVQAARVAAIPDEEFEALVESDHPPTVSQLAEIGKTAQPKKEP